MYDHVIDIAELIISMMLATAPRDTWNMINTIGYVVYDDNSLEIFIGGDYAPYATIVNEGRRDRPLSAKEQANKGWLDRVLEQVSMLIAEQNLGVVISSV